VTDYADINEGAKIMDVVTVKLWGRRRGFKSAVAIRASIPKNIDADSTSQAW